MTDEDTYSDSIRPQWIDATYNLIPREILNIDRIVMGVVRHKAIAQNYFPTIPIPKGRRKHEVNKAVELSEPMFDGNFMKEDLDKVRREIATHYLVPMHKDFALDMIDLDASRNDQYYDTQIDELNIREASLTIADYKERVIWRGYDILARSKTAANAQGVLNTSVKSIIFPATGTGTQNSFQAAGDNNGINSAGDGPLSIGAAMATEIADEYYGPYVFTMTPDVYGQLAQNFNSTTHISDIERMYSMIDLHKSSILEGMDTTKYLIKLESVADNGSMFMFQRKTPLGEPSGLVLEAYPVSHYPTQQSALGIKGKVLWMGCGAIVRAEAFTLETSVNLIA